MRKNRILFGLSCLVFFLSTKAFGAWEPCFDFSANFTQYGSGGQYYGDTVYNAIWLDCNNAGTVAAYAQLPYGHQKYKMDVSVSGSGATLTVVAGYQTFYVNSGDTFSWEGTDTQIYFYLSGGSYYNLLTEFYYEPVAQLPACHVNQPTPPQVSCPAWWNGVFSRYGIISVSANCLGYAKNETMYYGGLAAGGNTLTFPNSNTVSQAVNRIRTTMINDHGWTLLSTDVNYNVNTNKRVAALGVIYAHGVNSNGRTVNDFHLMRKDPGNVNWTEKLGEQKVKTLTVAQLRNKLNSMYPDNPASSPNGGSFFIGYFKTN